MSEIEVRSDSGRRKTGGSNDLFLFVKKVLIVVACLIALVLAWQVRYILVLIYIAGVLAAGISPVVRKVRVYGRMWLGRRIPRSAAVFIVYLPLLTFAVILIAVIAPTMIVEVQEMSADLPGLIEERLLAPARAQGVPVDAVVEWAQRYGSESKGHLFNYVWSVVAVLTSIVAVMFMVAYMLIDAERLRSVFLLFFPAESRSARQATIRRVSRRMSSWLGGQITLAAIVGLATGVGAMLLGIPYAIPLALIAAIGEVVPVIGPILGAIPLCLIALLQSRGQFWAALALAILVQQVENYFLVPRIMGHKVSISPLAVFIAFLMGATLFGIIGAILAVPTAAIIQVIFEEAFLARRERRSGDRSGVVVANDHRKGAVDVSVSSSDR